MMETSKKPVVQLRWTTCNQFQAQKLLSHLSPSCTVCFAGVGISLPRSQRKERSGLAELANVTVRKIELAGSSCSAQLSSLQLRPRKWATAFIALWIPAAVG